MPIYEYRCDKGHTFEVIQRMVDEPLTECTVCGAPVQRVFHPVAVHFKGSGFYTTDYGKKKTAGPQAARTQSKALETPARSPRILGHVEVRLLLEVGLLLLLVRPPSPTERYFSRALKKALRAVSAALTTPT